MYAMPAGSLDAYCNANYGYQCMDKILDPACPGLFRQDNVWMASTSKAQLCDPGCLRQLCQLQEQAKVTTTGESSCSGMQWAFNSALQCCAVRTASSVRLHHVHLPLYKAPTSSRCTYPCLPMHCALAGAPSVSGALPSITCADSELTTSVTWSLMRLVDTTCGFPGPANLACAKLLSPPQLCAADTQLSGVAGNLTDGAALGGNYSASTDCTWTVNTPEQPYITMNFTRLSTEPLYDLVTVEVRRRCWLAAMAAQFWHRQQPSSLATDTRALCGHRYPADSNKV